MFFFQESDDILKDRMINIESEIRTLRQKLSNQSDDDENSVDVHSLTDATAISNGPTSLMTHDNATHLGESNSVDTVSTNDLSESERRSLRRTRLHPRRFRQVNSTQDNEDDQDEEDVTQADQLEENLS